LGAHQKNQFCEIIINSRVSVQVGKLFGMKMTCSTAGISAMLFGDKRPEQQTLRF